MTGAVLQVVGAAKTASSGGDRRVLTQSEMSTFLHDRRKWYLAYYRRLKKRYDHPYTPSVGTLYHAGLEAYYREMASPLEVVRLRAEAMINDTIDDETSAKLLEAAELAGIMLEGYMEWLAETNPDAHLQIVGAEKKVEAPVGEFVLRGKIDARANDLRTGARIQLEHKTVGSLNDLPKHAQTNFQFLTYDLLAYLEAMAEKNPELRTDGVLLNMARRVKRTARANPPFYGRHEVRHNVEELRNHYRSIVGIGQEIVRATQRLDAGDSHHAVCPPTSGRDSTWSNPFFPVYAMMNDGSDWEGYLRDFYEEHDPLEHYEEEED